jgi:nicotinamidase-related amidase
MTDMAIDIARTAFVQIDLQNFNVNRELAPHPAERVVGNCVLLAGEMRNRGGMVIFVRVQLDELLSLPADNPMRKPGTPAPPPEASHMADAAQVQAQDHVVTKRQWGAF